jgi:hypothetical protein
MFHRLTLLKKFVKGIALLSVFCTVVSGGSIKPQMVQGAPPTPEIQFLDNDTSLATFSQDAFQEQTVTTADTVIDSDITADTTWTLAGSPYRISEEVHVTTGVALTIEPGVTVWLEKNMKLYVDGGATIIAKGTPAQPITFDRYRDPETGLAPRWKNIRLYPNSASYFRYVDFAYGGASSEESTILHFEGPGTHVLNMCTVRDSKLQGITAQGESLDLTIAGTLFENNGRWSLAYDSGADITVTGSTFNVADHIAIRLRDKDAGTATITVRDSNLLSDGSNVVVWNEMAGSISMDVRNNWWGQTSGPYAGAVTAGVDYIPWLTAEAPLVGITTPPTATFTVTPDPTVVQPPGTVYTFDASGSTDVEDYTSSLEVCWDWNNDGACDTSWTTTKAATHSFSSGDAVQTVRLVVRDTDGDTGEATRDILLNAIPTAFINISPNPYPALPEGTVYTFDASGSSDVEDPVSSLEVCWDWDNDDKCDTSWTTNKTATHSFLYDDGAVQTVRLAVRDTDGAIGEETRDIYIQQNFAPTAVFSFTQPAWNLVNFDASASTDYEDDDELLQVAWDYEGDGEHTSYSITKTTSYTYPHLGRYWPTVYVKDTVGRVGTSRQPLDIIPPTAAISLTGSGGTLTSVDGTVQVAVYTDTAASDVISNGLVITHTPWLTLPQGALEGFFTYQGFSLSAQSLLSGSQPLDEISGTYTITISYDNDYLADVLRLLFESNLKLYHWSDIEASWTLIPFTLKTADDQIVATMSSLGDFALAMDMSRLYLPLIARES